jgi:general secretion pathway protein G
VVTLTLAAPSARPKSSRKCQNTGNERHGTLLADSEPVPSQSKTERAVRSGVTRVEAGAFAAITVVVVAAAAVFLMPRDADAADQAARDAKRIQRVAADYRRENGSGCPTLTELERARLLPEDVRTDDPWGERFRVVCSGEDVSVTSPGRDGKPNTRDDIRVTAGAS